MRFLIILFPFIYSLNAFADKNVTIALGSGFNNDTVLFKVGNEILLDSVISSNHIGYAAMINYSLERNRLFKININNRILLLGLSKSMIKKNLMIVIDVDMWQNNLFRVNYKFVNSKKWTW